LPFGRFLAKEDCSPHLTSANRAASGRLAKPTVKEKMMKSKWMFAVVAVLALSAAVFDQAQAQTHFGVRGGFYMDQDRGFVGAHLLNKIQRNWMFTPSFEYVFVDPGSFFTINADLHYDFPSRSNTIFYETSNIVAHYLAVRHFHRTHSKRARRFFGGSRVSFTKRNQREIERA
jgi:hypothetical protein